jgi:hypothetical protein
VVHCLQRLLCPRRVLAGYLAEMNISFSALHSVFYVKGNLKLICPSYCVLCKRPSMYGVLYECLILRIIKINIDTGILPGLGVRDFVGLL